MDDIDWHHISDVLDVLFAQRLEGNTDDLLLAVHHWTPAVARIDGCVDLDSEELCGGLGVLLHLYARDHAAADADAVSTHGVADHCHVLLQIWDLAKLQTVRMHQQPSRKGWKVYTTGFLPKKTYLPLVRSLGRL